MTKFNQINEVFLKSMKLIEVCKEHIHKDELAGNFIIVPADKLTRSIESLIETIEQNNLNYTQKNSPEAKTISHTLNVLNQELKSLKSQINI